MKNIKILSFVYLGIFLLLIKGLLDQNYTLQFITKIALSLVLLIIYLSIGLSKRRDRLYITMLVFVCLGQLFFIKQDVYFIYTFYCYLIMHILFVIIIYTKYLKNKSLFDVFTFSLPFLLMFSVIYVLLEDLNFWWSVRVLVFGFVCCLNATLAPLSYMETRNKMGFLLFIGVFIWIVVDGLAIVNLFNLRERTYYNIIVFIDAIASYLVCLGFVIGSLDSEKDDDIIVVK